ncbi:STM2901 family protein [Erwinia tasmaniensis]|uniref:STM2901 family protein n=1 Tax=Erwinia tasmaniensis TaxID=338565 RepID=UPI003A4DE929
MDTIEELNGTYFYNGMHNLSAGELFFWIFIEKIDDQYGIHDLVAVSSIILGLPLLKTRAKPGPATKGTSIASRMSRQYLDIHLPFRLPTITNKSIKLLKPMYVNNLGAFVGRTVPVVGWLLLANDFAQITFKTMITYNRIARGGDKVW